MGIGLIVEVMDHAPEGISSGQRLVLLVIAEWANDATRVAIQTKTWTLDTICRRAGIQRAGLKSILQGLAKKGLEVRVPISVKDGKPTFAYEGKAVTFKLPELAKRGCQDIPSERGRADIPTSPEGMPQHPSGDAVASERGGHSHPHPLIYPSRNPSKNSLSLSPREADDVEPVEADEPERDGLDQEEENAFQRLLRIEAGITDQNRADLLIYGADHLLPGGGKGIGWWKALTRQGDLPDVIEEIEGRLSGQPESAPLSPADARLAEGAALAARLDARIPPDQIHPFRPAPGGLVCEVCYSGERDPRHRDAGLSAWDPARLDRRYAAQPVQRGRNGRPRHRPFLNSDYTEADWHAPL